MRYLQPPYVRLGLAMAVGLTVSQAQAATILELTSDGTTITIVDGGIGDLSSADGVVVFSGLVGDFDVNVTTGLSTPLIGSPASPVMDLNSINVSSTSTGSLTVMLTSTDLTGPASGTATLNVGGTTNGDITIESFVDSSNTAFGTAVSTGSLGTFSDGPFSGTDGASTEVTPNYSATIMATIVHNDLGDVSSFDAEYRIVPVPEPGSAILLGLGGMALAIRRRR